MEVAYLVRNLQVPIPTDRAVVARVVAGKREQTRKLEQLLTIQEEEIGKLKKRIDELRSVVLLQAEVNKAQKEFNQLIRQQLEAFNMALQATMGLVHKLADTILPEKPAEPAKSGVSEVG